MSVEIPQLSRFEHPIHALIAAVIVTELSLPGRVNSCRLPLSLDVAHWPGGSVTSVALIQLSTYNIS
jgi:hypothetical protein